jgi:hypothetical protein
MVETMTGAVAKAVEKLSGRKVGIALVGMWLISTTQVQEARLHIFWLCVVALATQMVQDIVEVLVTGKDLSETNGNGNGKEKPSEPIPVTKNSEILPKVDQSYTGLPSEILSAPGTE